MLRLFVPTSDGEGGRIRIAGAELRHLRTVRPAPGSRLRILDGTGAEHDVVLERIGTREAEARIVATTRPNRESPLDLTLAPALLKGTKMDLVVEKTVELGAARLCPVVSARAVGRGEHLERWRRIAVAAAKQSGRVRVPAVDVPRPLAEVVGAPWPGLRLLPWEDEHTRRPAELPAAATAIVALVGPEGGFAPDEVATARAAGFVTVSLGPRILRAETAAIALAALCQHRWGDG